jgi:hypothetical protein
MSMGDMSQHAEREERKTLDKLNDLELKVDIIKRIADLAQSREFLIDVLIDLKKINDEIPN